MPAHPLPAACRLPLLLLQLTAHQLAAQRERELAELEKQAAQRALEGKRAVDEEAYAAALAVENKNRCAGAGGMLGASGWGDEQLLLEKNLCLSAGWRRKQGPCSLLGWASVCQQLSLLVQSAVAL